MSVEHAIRVAWRKAGAITGWEPCILQRVGPDAMTVRGGIPRIRTRGKNKGHKWWDKIGDPVVVTDAEARTERENWERTTGKCGECVGEGKVLIGWSAKEGTRFDACKTCGGTGRLNATPIAIISANKEPIHG